MYCVRQWWMQYQWGKPSTEGRGVHGVHKSVWVQEWCYVNFCQKRVSIDSMERYKTFILFLIEHYIFYSNWYYCLVLTMIMILCFRGILLRPAIQLSCARIGSACKYQWSFRRFKWNPTLSEINDMSMWILWFIF